MPNLQWKISQWYSLLIITVWKNKINKLSLRTKTTKKTCNLDKWDSKLRTLPRSRASWFGERGREAATAPMAEKRPGRCPWCESVLRRRGSRTTRRRLRGSSQWEAGGGERGEGREEGGSRSRRRESERAARRTQEEEPMRREEPSNNSSEKKNYCDGLTKPIVKSGAKPIPT